MNPTVLITFPTKIQRQSRLPLEPQIVPGGFLFVWTPKALIARMLKVTTAWGLRYVENICWVKLDAAHHTIHGGLSTTIGESKMTLLILRKVRTAKKRRLPHFPSD